MIAQMTLDEMEDFYIYTCIQKLLELAWIKCSMLSVSYCGPRLNKESGDYIDFLITLLQLSSIFGVKRQKPNHSNKAPEVLKLFLAQLK